ncbi:hypothetical protein ACYFX5_25730 [Bremerella sp. T1]|uniref:Ig-like domain-containing protein n=1 Tax=Bremerella sp. TYQ1 TaxID=3119568 RepID=UPI001CCF099E|nr:Ig-like domain-containing protein [Bremerella volcania]UBM36411.1 Ig-like domain-containing protein [Bremerella volcania]
MYLQNKLLVAFCVSLSLSVLPGCFSGSSVPVGPVSGVVTKDGQPLADATVTFFPESGRPSIGMTDESGRYELLFTESVNGAMVGLHKVNISFGGPPPPGEMNREKKNKRVLPPQSVDWPDMVKVSESYNTLDFDL